ncbi:MAG: hypothetical protein EOP48_34630, partial [Sphingobacteriales bacterium]
LNAFDKRFEEFLIINAPALSQFHPRTILDYVLGREEEKKKEIKVLDYLDTYFKNTILKNAELSSGTIRNYNKSLNHFRTFLTSKGKENLTMNQLDNITAIQFKDYLQTTDTKAERKGMTEVSASSVLKTLSPFSTGQ